MMMKEFFSINEVITELRPIVDKYFKDAPIHTQSTSTQKTLTKNTSFIVMVNKDDDGEVLENEFIKLRAKGWNVLQVERQTKWSDQMDIVGEIVSITVPVSIRV